MTPLNVFAKMAAKQKIDLDDDALKAFRDLIDAQADLVLDGFLAGLHDNPNKHDNDPSTDADPPGDLHRQRQDIHDKTTDWREPEGTGPGA